MNKLIQKICKEVINKYKKDKNVLGIMLFGSAVKDKLDKYSDIDIYILLKKKGKYSRCNFLKNKYRIDIILDSIKQAKKYLNEDKYNIRRNTSHMLSHGQIIYQRTKDLKKIQKIAKNNLKLKTKYKDGEILMHKYSIDDFWGEVQRDVKKNDFFSFELDSQLLINNIIELFLKLNGEFFRRPDKMELIFNQLDIKFTKMIKSFYKSADIQVKKLILSKLVRYIYTKSGGKLPKEWQLDNLDN